MGSEVEACAECSRNCLLTHQRSDPFPIVCSFFKVMYGMHFADLVTVPSRFARLASLVARETYLEDSAGRKWNVALSELNGSFAIQKGWKRFVVDHGIQMGDFVVFHYIKGSHFIVQAYGTHGCEKLSLAVEEAYQNKIAKATKYSIAKPACADSRLDIDDIRRPDVVKQPPLETRGTTSRAKGFIDDTPLIVNKHEACEDDRDHLFDLSVYEMPNKTVDANKTNNLQILGYRCSQVVDALQKAQTGTASNSFNAKKCLTTEGSTFSKLGVSWNLSERKEEFNSRKEYTPSGTCPRTGIPLTTNISPKPEFSAMPGGRTALKQEPKTYTPHIRGNPTAHISVHARQHEHFKENVMHKSGCNWIQQKYEFPAASDDHQPSGVKVGSVKQEPRDFENMDHMVNDDSDHGIIFKSDPADLCHFSSAPITKISCHVQPDSEAFLELPECLPLRACGQASKVQRKLVFLQDPARRVWPVVYHQQYGLNVLASGWRAFREANNLHPGDECILVVENMDEGRFLVQIHRTERSSSVAVFCHPQN